MPAPRYLIKAKAPANGRHKYSGLFFVNGSAETDDPDQVTYARAQGWELTRLAEPEPQPGANEDTPPTGTPAPDGDTAAGAGGETASADPSVEPPLPTEPTLLVEPEPVPSVSSAYAEPEGDVAEEPLPATKAMKTRGK
jgi:hypothetical protein